MKKNDSLHLGSPQEYIITQKALRYTMGHISVEGSKEKKRAISRRIHTPLLEPNGDDGIAMKLFNFTAIAFDLRLLNRLQMTIVSGII